MNYKCGLNAVGLVLHFLIFCYDQVLYFFDNGSVMKSGWSLTIKHLITKIGAFRKYYHTLLGYH